ncbi:hypothetical protein K461DRAFT_288504 [Myriangium duriaei CBS 260.36]|uniref:Uncharacterized protein n=1 Tax=Myriangium duriaei CBS 260.36 TaxID=1168546 RepID=A0A9P4IRB3_9PEZI|nr:hypothetical protein K461DRAFT_288504 [Myriangium duriaei CBS 260.36]
MASPPRPAMPKRLNAAIKTSQKHPIDETRRRDASPHTSLPASPSTPTFSKPVSIPSRSSSRASTSTRTPTWNQERAIKPRRTTDNLHRPDALAPSVAALLALTAIPPRKSARQRLDNRSRRISIEELVQEWRAESLGSPANASHKSMEMLLEPCEVACVDSLDSLDGFPISRLDSNSTSSDSTPSLEADDARSLLSIGNPPTPDALRILNSASLGSSRKAKQRSLTSTEDCALDHPLIPRSVPEIVVDDELAETESFTAPSTKSTDTRKSSFKSNLTSSLQNLKSRALNSLSQLSLSNVGPTPSYHHYAFSDATLWQHPFLFPRVGPEIRPNAVTGTATQYQRRYFNPTVLSFDEQQSRFRKALHSSQPEPDRDRHSPMILMKTYSRPLQKRATGRKSSQGADTEAGRALSAPNVRSREARENSDFLRVVVLEMNMRRVGKLDDTAVGRAKIWLPPRQMSAYPADDADNAAENSGPSLQRSQSARVTPRRWRSISADD